MSRYFPQNLRRRLAWVVLVVGLLLFGKMAYEEVPQEQRVRLVLTASQRESVRTVQVTYSSEDEDVLSGWEQRFPNGAPAELVHEPSLRPGRYLVSIDLVSADGTTTHFSRTLEVPSYATTQISLGDLP